MDGGKKKWPVWKTNSLSSGKCPDNLCSHIRAAFVPVFQEPEQSPELFFLDAFHFLLPCLPILDTSGCPHLSRFQVSDAFFSRKWPWFPWTNSSLLRAIQQPSRTVFHSLTLILITLWPIDPHWTSVSSSNDDQENAYFIGQRQKKNG